MANYLFIISYHIHHIS